MALHSFLSFAQSFLSFAHAAKPRSTSYPPSSYFRHQHPSGHTVLVHSFHMPKPSQYSLSTLLANSLSIPALLRTSSFITLSIHNTPTKLLKHFIARTFTFLLSALLIPHASAHTTLLVQLLLQMDIFGLYPQSSILSTLFSAPQALYPSFLVCTTFLGRE